MLRRIVLNCVLSWKYRDHLQFCSHNNKTIMLLIKHQLQTSCGQLITWLKYFFITIVFMHYNSFLCTTCQYACYQKHIYYRPVLNQLTTILIIITKTNYMLILMTIIRCIISDHPYSCLFPVLNQNVVNLVGITMIYRF